MASSWGPAYLTYCFDVAAAVAAACEPEEADGRAAARRDERRVEAQPAGQPRAVRRDVGEERVHRRPGQARRRRPEGAAARRDPRRVARRRRVDDDGVEAAEPHVARRPRALHGDAPPGRRVADGVLARAEVRRGAVEEQRREERGRGRGRRGRAPRERLREPGRVGQAELRRVRGVGPQALRVHDAGARGAACVESKFSTRFQCARSRTVRTSLFGRASRTQ
mmetsp:Transcript_9853/g.33926  ORF Transcript_9853/g.33926 Transcript_9853/m.33926 type:complete len:223 (-) Transcript_9853:7-675(-)